MRKITSFILILLLVFTLGFFFSKERSPSAEYQARIEALQLETTARLNAIKVGFWGGLAIVVLFSSVGIIAGLIRTIWSRSQLVHPHDHGLFPIVKGRIGKQIYYHDPNRQLPGSITYTAGAEGITARPLTPSHSQNEQLQVTTQAQATQLVAAAGQGRGLSAQSRQLVERVALSASAHPIPNLPQVTILDKTIPEERDLLADLYADWDTE